MPYVRKLTDTKWRGEYRDQYGHKHTRTFATKTAAKTWASDREQDVRKGVHLDPKAGKLTVREWEALWWAARVAEPSTIATDRGRIDKHILPAFGGHALAEVSSLAVQGWVRRLEVAGLGPATIRACHQLLAVMLKAAVLDGRIMRNPCEPTKLPALPGGRELFLTREQVDAIADAMKDDRYACVVLFLAYTGLRWGETAGLMVRDLDLLRREVHVRQVLEEVGGAKRIKAYPKNRASRRTVGLPLHVVDAVAAHLAANPAGRDELAFRGPRGAALSRVHFNLRTWRPALAVAKLDGLGVRPHDLRHTCASWLVQDGVSLYEVAAQLGHSSTSMVQRYAHLAPDRHVRARAVLERPDAKTPAVGAAGVLALGRGGLSEA